MVYRAIKNKIIESGIFNAKFYENKYPDVALIKGRKSQIDPLDHYIMIGSRLGRIPHPALKKEDLGAVNWDVPLDKLPIVKLIDKYKLVFDPAWYLEKYKDIALKDVDPLKHYREAGRHENRSPNRVLDKVRDLDPQWYLKTYGDEIEKGITPFTHYLSVGIANGNRTNNKKQIASHYFRRFSISEYASKADFTLEADTSTVLDKSFNMSIAVHMHIFYDSLLEEMLSYVVNIAVPYDIYISIPENTYDVEDIIARVRPYLNGAGTVIVREFENIGRDIAPMLAGFGPELLRYDLLLHMHSKRSLHNPDQSAWRRYLLHYTCGNQNITNQILNYFAKNQDVGGCFPPYHGNLRDQPSYGKNLDNIVALCERIGVPAVNPEVAPDYPAGSFFWIRTQAIEPLLNGSLTYKDFDPELGQVDNTTAHAIERLLGYVPETLGFKTVMPFVDVPYDLINYFPQSRVSPQWSPRKLDIEAITGTRHGKPKNRIAMVTAITGGFDPLIIHEHLSSDIDYICFSNAPLPDGYGIYEVRIAPYEHPDMRRVARFVKTNLAHLLPEYETVVWIDANLQLTAPIDYLIDGMRAKGMSIAAVPHPIRRTVHEEAEAVLAAGLDDADLIREQMAKYAVICPDLSQERLIESNFMIFDMTDPRVSRVTDLWWSEIQAHSKRDQLSLNYALRAHNVAWMPIVEDNYSMRDCKFSRMFSHGAGPRYIRNADGSLQVISASVRKGQIVQIASISEAASLIEMQLNDTDARVKVESISTKVDITLLDMLDAIPNTENVEDLSLDRLQNGVSLQNWVPRRWARKSWNASIGITKLHNAACFGGTITKTMIDGHENGQLVLTSDGSLCEASFGLWNGEHLLPRNLITPVGDESWELKQGVGPTTFVGDYYLLGTMQPHFGHSLLEGLSRLWAMLEYPEIFGEMPILIFEHSLKSYQSEFLALAGIDEKRVVHIPNTGVTVEKLWVPDPAIRSHRWISKRQGLIWRRISDSVSTANPHRKVYLSRTRISERPLTNESEVEAIMRSKGFEVVHPETLSVREQIKVAAEAAHIVGPVGSQMYLAAFQKAGTYKTVLAPSNFYAKDDSMISTAIGNNCNVIFGERINNFSERSERRWSIDLSQQFFSSLGG